MKRPEYEEWKMQWVYYKEDKEALAEHYDVSLVTIYNWIHYFEDHKIDEDAINKLANEMKVDSDVEDEELQTFKHYVKLQKESPNKPDVRECSLSIPGDYALIIGLADCHFGSIYTDVDRAEEVKEVCATTPNVYGFYGGDLTDYEGSGPPDIRFDQAFAHPKTTRAMAESWIKEFNGSMLLMVTGCHDNWTYRWTGETFPERLTKYIPTKAVFNDSVIVNLTVGDVTYQGHVGHKAGKGNSRYNPSHGGFQEMRETFDGDFVMTAHRHTPGIAMQFIRQKPCMVINCGTFKKIDFFSNKQFLQQPLSIPAVFFDGKNKRMVPFFNWRDGLRYIQTLESKQENMEQLPSEI